MYTFKKLLVKLAIALTPIFLSPSSFALPTIGVILASDHPALNEAAKGILDELEAQELIDKNKSNWQLQSAQGKLVTANAIAVRYASMDIIVGVGTLPTQATVAAIKSLDKRPQIAFASVTSPEQARLVPSDKQPWLEITGVSDYVDSKQQFETFLEVIKPQLTNGKKLRLGIIFNPGEENSINLNKKMQETADAMGTIELVFMPATRTCDVAAATQNLIAKEVDAIFVNNDNTALTAFRSITKIANAAKTPVFVSDVDIVDQGAVLALGPNQYKGGREVGQKIAKIAKGEKANNIPITTVKDVELYINKKVAEEIGLTIPKAMLDKAAKVI